jgi:hypothetical protein
MGRGVQGHAAWKPNEIDPVMPGDGSEILSQPRVAAKRTTRVWERTTCVARGSCEGALGPIGRLIENDLVDTLLLADREVDVTPETKHDLELGVTCRKRRDRSD